MSQKSLLMSTLLFTLLGQTLCAESSVLKDLTGSWHLRVLDGKEVRKARAIVEFDAKAMKISGFDSCNSVNGLLKQDPKSHNYYTKLITTRMACRSSLHAYVSQKFHQALASYFIVKKEKKYGINGISIKSAKHELFFKKMGKDSIF